jgi:hypothetical protein
VVKTWLIGTKLPTASEWDFLLCVSRDFHGFQSLWRDARSEPDPAPDPAPESLGDLAVLPEILSEGTGGTSGRQDDVVLPEVQVPPRCTESPESTSGPAASTPPAGFVVYACKISKGRVVKLVVPNEFSRVDASRVYAFLLTQTDDFLPPDGLGEPGDPTTGRRT